MKMTDFVGDLETRYATHEEVEQLLKEARSMRAKAMRDSAVSIWEMLQHAVSRKPVRSAALQH